MDPMTALLSRRNLVRSAASVAALAALAQAPTMERASAAPPTPAGDNPFTLGIASGSPRADGVVLWTRLAPRLFEPGGGMPSRRVPVQWAVSEDPRMRRYVRAGSTWAAPGLGHSVHVEVEGLQPGRDYWYRFRYGRHLTEVGHTRTAPAPGAPVPRLTFAASSCAKWDDGWFTAYRAMAQEDLDFVLHLGDYVYEYAIAADGGNRRGAAVPQVLTTAPQTLDRWRYQYEIAKSDPDLQLLHQRFPWVVTWDDHEVADDYANHQSKNGDITAVRANAYQAWYEHSPVRAAAGRRSGPQVYGRLGWGDLVQLDVLDGRQHRDVPPCGWGEAQACRAAYDPAITMLGQEQERWLYDGLHSSSARWNVIGSDVMMARLDHDGDAGDLLWNDAWDGFPEARNRLCRNIVDARVRNAVIVSGDWHSTFVSDIHADFDVPGSPTIATEFVDTSITTNGDTPVYGPYYGPMIKFNPHIRFFDGDRRGYHRYTVDRDTWRTDLRMVRSVGDPDATDYTFASFEVADGRPGAVQV